MRGTFRSYTVTILFTFIILCFVQNHGLTTCLSDVEVISQRTLRSPHLLILLQRPPVIKFKKEFSDERVLIENDHFIQLVARQQQNSRTSDNNAPLVFYLENSVLKDLNDTIFQDKQLADAVNGFFFSQFYQSMHQSNQLPNIIYAQYKDYKSFCVHCSGTPLQQEEFARQLQDVYMDEVEQLDTKLYELHLDPLYRELSGRFGRPKDWMLGGIGHDYFQASLAARAARDPFLKELFPGQIVWKFFELKNYFQGRLTKIRSLEQQLANLDSPGGWLPKIATELLTLEMVEVMRKIRITPSTNLPLQKLSRQLSARSGRDITASLARLLFDLYTEVDFFVAPLLIRKRQQIPVEQAQNTIISLDFVGLGAENLMATYRGIREGKYQLSAAMDKIVANIQLVDKRIERAKEHFVSIVTKITGNDMTPRFYFSGDDGAFFSDQGLSVQQKINFLQSLEQGSSFRLRPTFVQVFYDNNQPISTTHRSKLIFRGELLEKTLHKLLWQGSGISQTTLAQLVMAFDCRPLIEGKYEYTLYLSHTVDKETRELIEAYAAMVVKELGNRLEVGMVFNGVIDR